MISLKIGAIVAAAFIAGSFLAPPVQQAIAAIIATDVQCQGCVNTGDLAGNAVTATKIKDGEVKAAEIATDAVGAAEIQGVTKLMFGQCALSEGEQLALIQPNVALDINCNINGVDNDDNAFATLNDANGCFSTEQAQTFTGTVHVLVRNNCGSNTAIGSGASIAVLVYDK